jgi:anti-sigma B factor antagonist
VCPEGRLDALSAHTLDEDLSAAELSGHRVVLNCQQVTYVSSSCLRVILVHARSTRRQGGDLKLCCLAPKVEYVLLIAGFDRVLQLLPTEVDARQAFEITALNAEIPSPPP